MKIGQILREKQPREHNILTTRSKQKKPRSKSKEHISSRDIESLMSHSCYKRRNMAVSQIK